jgi:hypothetical protein
MKKVLCLMLAVVFTCSFFAGTTAAPVQTDDVYVCFWRCHTIKGELYNCCRIVSPGGGGQLICWIIGTC